MDNEKDMDAGRPGGLSSDDGAASVSTLRASIPDALAESILNVLPSGDNRHSSGKVVACYLTAGELRGIRGLATDVLRGPSAQDALLHIATERQRQVKSEGWTPEHDDTHTSGEMAAAAGCYALHFAARVGGERAQPPHAEWPWDFSWWKPSEELRRDLIKAAALLVAEIERLDRAKEGELG